MRLIRNYNPLWSELHISQTKSHENSFGVYLSKEEMDIELENIKNKTPTRRVSKNVEVYEIFTKKNHYCGDITLTPISIKTYEFDLFIFDSYKRQGLGSSALEQFIEFFSSNYEASKLQAIVRPQNPFRAVIISMLEKNNFSRISYGYDVLNDIYSKNNSN